MAITVMTGDLHLTDLQPECFWRLENVWLDEVKQSLAYFNWIDRRDQEEFWSHPTAREQHYSDACDRIQNLLVERKVKERLDNFSIIRGYIENLYIDEFHRFQTEYSSHSSALLRSKVDRLGPKATGGPAEALAEEYCRKFYENIVPAIETCDEESCVSVLQALQYGRVGLPEFPSIANSFELAVVIAFLDATTVQRLWRTAERVSKYTTF